jgi:hypothetical protein
LIYTTPNNEKDRVGNLQTSRLDFFRVNLDGSDHRRIYTTSTQGVRVGDFDVVRYPQGIFLLVKDGDNLRRVRVSGSGTFGRADPISTKSTSHAFPQVSSYDAFVGRSLESSFDGIMENLYFTESFSENNISGTDLKQYNIATGTTTSIRIPDQIIEVMALGNGRLVYTQSKIGQDKANDGVYLQTAVFTENNQGLIATRVLHYENIVSVTHFHSGEKYYLQTERDASFRIVGHLNNTIYIYNTADEQNIVRVDDVENIIQISANRIHFQTGNGTVRSVNLYAASTAVANAFADINEFRPDAVNRVSVITRHNHERYFYIKSFTAENDTTNSMMMANIRNLTVSGGHNAPKQYILGRVDKKFFA